MAGIRATELRASTGDRDEGDDSPGPVVSHRKFPSDHRPYFRAMESILDNEKLNALSLADQGLYFRLLAMLNRQDSRDGWGRLDRHAVCSVAKRERWPYALGPLLALANAQLIELMCACGKPRVALRCDDGTRCSGVSYRVPNWSRIQGFTPAEVRSNSAATPTPRGEETRKEETGEQRSPEGGVEFDPNVLVRLLAKERGTAEEKLEWLRGELPIIELKAAEDHPADATRRVAGTKSRVLSHYRQHLKSNAGRVTPIDRARRERRVEREAELRRHYVGRLIREPTEESFEEWVAAGRPSNPAWWDPEGVYRPTTRGSGS